MSELMKEWENATITGAEISVGREGMLVVLIKMSLGKEEKWFGEFGVDLIWKYMLVAGARNWSDMAGRNVRIKYEGDRVFSIGHIVDDDHFTEFDWMLRDWSNTWEEVQATYAKLKNNKLLTDR